MFRDAQSEREVRRRCVSGACGRLKKRFGHSEETGLFPYNKTRDARKPRGTKRSSSVLSHLRTSAHNVILLSRAKIQSKAATNVINTQPTSCVRGADSNRSFCWPTASIRGTTKPSRKVSFVCVSVRNQEQIAKRKHIYMQNNPVRNLN